MNMLLRKFDYVYKDENEKKHIACVSHATIEPTYDFTVEVGKSVYLCIVDHLMSDEWKINIVCVSDEKDRQNYFAELSRLDDVFWNAESICQELHNYGVSKAIAQGLADIYHRFNGSFQ